MNICIVQGNSYILFYVNSLQYTYLYIRCLSNWNTIGQISHKKEIKAFMALDSGGSEMQAIKVLEKLYIF